LLSPLNLRKKEYLRPTPLEVFKSCSMLAVAPLLLWDY